MMIIEFEMSNVKVKQRRVETGMKAWKAFGLPDGRMLKKVGSSLKWRLQISGSTSPQC